MWKYSMPGTVWAKCRLELGGGIVLKAKKQTNKNCELGQSKSYNFLLI